MSNPFHSTLVGDKDLDGDICDNLAEQFLHPWKINFQGFRPNQRSSIQEVMIGAASLAYLKWGVAWPRHIFLKSVTLEEDAFSYPYELALRAAIEMKVIPLPELAFVVLGTKTYQMAMIHTGSHALAVDGLCDPNLKKLAEMGMKVLLKTGYQRKTVDFPQFWTQHDGHSCGYLVLNFLDAVLFHSFLEPGSTNQVFRDIPKDPDWTPLANKMEVALGELGFLKASQPVVFRVIPIIPTYSN